MPYCMNSGKQLSGEKFCSGCGTPLNAQKPYPDQSQNPKKKLKGIVIGSNSAVCIVILIIIGLTLNKAQPSSMSTNEARTIIAEAANSVTIPKNTTPQQTFYPDGRLLSAGGDHLVGLRANGTVVAKGNNETGACNVSNWKGIVAVAAGDEHTVGLMSNGKVVATGTIDCGTGDVSNWNDIVAIAAGSGSIIGLKSDGTVESAGNYIDHDALSKWRDIVAISAGELWAVGLKSDGTVVGVQDDQILNSVSQWRDIVAISVGYYHVVGLKSDGTVVATGFNAGGQCNVSAWKDIVAIAAGESCTLGLKADGTVVAAGDNYCGQCDVSDWENIVAISAGYAFTVGLKSDGTLVTAGSNYSGQCDVSSWNLFLAADNGNTQTTVDPLDGGQTYNIYRSSKVLQMKRGKHYPYIVDPEIVDCLGFTMKFSYNVPDGNYVKNIWEVWLRENGNSWIMVGTIAVNEGETKEYVINFSRPITFSEIAIQHPIDYNNYSFTDNLTISNIQY